MHVFKEVVCQWPPLAVVFQKRDSSLSNQERRKVRPMTNVLLKYVHIPFDKEQRTR